MFGMEAVTIKLALSTCSYSRDADATWLLFLYCIVFRFPKSHFLRWDLKGGWLPESRRSMQGLTYC
eukprot:scaffold116352_cov32-Prasinocladus_malaysianus.AAC.1